MPGKRLTTNEIADYCGVNFIAVRKWILSGQLRAAQIPGRPEYHVELVDFLDFLKSNAMPVPRKLLTTGHRVLVVDDDELMTQLIDATLKEAGFETFVARDGFIGGATLESYRPTLMTLDIVMPSLDGIGVLKFIRSKERLLGTRILVVSALPQERLDEALQAGAHDTLRKPFDPPVLLDKIFALAGGGR
jgi:two-component system, OmpR family, response regulator VicR